MKQFYLHDGRHKHGPYHPEEMLQFQITRQTSVFAVDVNQWVNAGEVSELKMLFEQVETNENKPWKKVVSFLNRAKRN